MDVLLSGILEVLGALAAVPTTKRGCVALPVLLLIIVGVVGVLVWFIPA